MRVQELFAKVNREELIRELASYHEPALVEAILDDFADIRPFISHRVLTDEETITNTVFGFCGPVELAEWSDTLGAEIDEKIFEELTETELAARLYEEMTEHGIERSDHSSEITRLLDGGSLAI